MKLFARNIVLFFSPIFLLGYIADYVIVNSLLRSRKDDFGVWNDLMNGKINSDIVIYGSSRAWIHIDPKIIEDSTHQRTYNLGIDGHNFYMEYLRHRLLLRNNRQPKKIILSLDCFTLYKRVDLYNDQQFLGYLKDTMIKNAISTYKGYSYFDYKLPMAKFFGKKEALEYALLDICNQSENKPNRYNGYAGQTTNWNDDLENAKASGTSYIQLFDSTSVVLFDQFLNECKQKKINILFVYTPEYIEGQNFVSNRKTVFEYFNSFSQKYSIPFLDYSNDSMCSNRNYFYNSQHLNANGSKIFTKHFVSDMKRIHFL